MATKRSVGTLKEGDLKGKRVFVRVDLNVPLDDNLNITDDTRVRAAVPTIKYLTGHGAKVILSSHLGRPKGVTPKYSLKPLVPRLSQLLGIEVTMANDSIGEEVEKLVAQLPEGGVLLLENVRFYKEEEKNDPEFAKKLASLADLYVNDAFGTAHRAHASTEGVAKYLKPSVAGFLMQKELDYLVGAVSNPKRPFAAIVGGSKVSSKIGVIESLLEKVNVLLLGGGMIFTFYKAQGYSVGSSLVEEDKLSLATTLLEKAKAKGVSLLLPTDVVIADKFAGMPCPLMADTNTCQGSALTPLTRKLSQISNKPCQPKVIRMSKTSFASQQENRAVEAEVMPSDLDSCLQQHSVSYNARSAFSNITGLGSLGQSGLSVDNLALMEQQILSGIGNRDNVNPCVNASSSLNMSQLKTDGDHLLGHNMSFDSTSLVGGVPLHGGMSTLLSSTLITSSGSKSPRASTAVLSGVGVGIGPQNCDSSTKARVCSLANLTSQPGTFPKHVEGSDQKILPVDLKCASTNQKIDYDMLQAPNLPSFQVEEHVPINSQIPGFAHDCLLKDGSSQSMMTMDPKHKLDCAKPPSGDDLFDVLGVDLKNQLLNGNWDNLFTYESDANAENMDKKIAPMNMQGATTNPDIYSVKEAISDCGMFSGMGTDHLLDAVVSKAKSVVKQDSDDMSCRTTLTRNSTSSVPSPARRTVVSGHFQGGLFDLPKNDGKTGATETSFLRSGCNKDDAGNCSQTSSVYGSQLSSWVENSGSVKCENSASTRYSKRPDEACKPNRKRLKPGENPRPRPKDRQMIQDRVKELREIVPNGAKCSIDALLERTIKHMLFLQSVTKHADKLKQTGESKIINKEGGLLLKDNFEGGATWAYEVGSQSMVCPIVVEDLNPPRQMLVEMLCEERGFFLEIADLIRGLGLTILKGVMEAHNDKIWARFAVEANRDLTRMEIFMSLVRLLEKTVKGNTSPSNAIDNKVYHSFPQAAQIPVTGRPSSLQ